MIELTGVSKSFGGYRLLNDIGFKIKKGEKVSLLGPGASGKSTIIKLLLGLLPPDSGKVELMGLDMVASTEAARQKVLRKVGMSFQQGALFDYMTVEENLRFAMDNMTEFTPQKKEDHVTYLLENVKLPHTQRMFPYELSGGMQRRVGVARAITTDPDIAIFDEPTSGLDPVTSTIILNMINSLIPISSGKTVMVVTSSVEIAIRFADRLILLRDGKVVADGPWRDLLIESSEWIQNFLGVRLIGTDIGYARELGLPEEFIKKHW